MLDVHPPHQAAHTWRDFFLHIATICVGLLIAIALEQSVEALHRQHERSQLRASLHGELLEIESDTVTSEATLADRKEWLRARIGKVQAAVWQHQPLPPPPPHTGATVLARPDDPLWRSAKTSGLAPLLTEQEVTAYSEIELLAAKIDVAYDRMVVAHSQHMAFEHQFPSLNGSPDLSQAAAEDLRKYLTLLTEEQYAIYYIGLMVAEMQGAEHAILQGNLDLKQIQAAEKESTPASN
jgi:hypothetical protein